MKSYNLDHLWNYALSAERISRIFQVGYSLVWILAVSAGLTGTPTYAAAVAYSSYGDLRQAAGGLPGAKVSLSFSVLDSVSLPTPVTMSNIAFNGRWFVRRAAFSQVISEGQIYLNNFESDVPLRVHFPTGARAFGAFFSSWSGAQFTGFTGTATTDQGDRFVVQGPTDSGAGLPLYLGLVSSDSIYDITFDDGGIFVLPGGYKTHEEMVADVFAILNPVPSLAVSRLPSGVLNVQIDGAIGQTVVLLSSTNLTDWHSIVTNKLTSPQWVYTATASPARSSEFFMLKLR